MSAKNDELIRFGSGKNGQEKHESSGHYNLHRISLNLNLAVKLPPILRSPGIKMTGSQHFTDAVSFLVRDVLLAKLFIQREECLLKTS